MNRLDLNQVVSRASGVPLAQTTKVIGCLFDQVLPKILLSGEPVRLRGFGMFFIRHRGAYPVVQFRPFQTLKKAIREQ